MGLNLTIFTIITVCFTILSILIFIHDHKCIVFGIIVIWIPNIYLYYSKTQFFNLYITFLVNRAIL